MSIYSGFATRNLEQFYDKMIYNLLSTLLLRVAKIYRREPVDEQAFLKIVLGHEKNLRKMEKRKVTLLVCSISNPSTRSCSLPLRKKSRKIKCPQSTPFLRNVPAANRAMSSTARCPCSAKSLENCVLTSISMRRWTGRSYRRMTASQVSPRSTSASAARRSVRRRRPPFEATSTSGTCAKKNHQNCPLYIPCMHCSAPS